MSTDHILKYCYIFFWVIISDHVFLPTQSGAMENWGLIIYGERVVLWDEDWYGANNRASTGYFLSHEIAHFVRITSNNSS